MKRMKFILSLFSVLLATNLIAQKHKPFTGKLVYKIEIRDTNMRQFYPENRMIVYTNDTITRIENFTEQLGKQVVIRHLELNKSYTLINTPKGDFAIKVDHNKAPDETDSIAKKTYTLDKKCGKEKILEMKAKKLIVEHPDLEESEQYLYLKSYSNSYLNNFEDSPGLLVKYSIASPDGQLDYELIEFKEYLPERDLFGIPDNYRRVTIDEFVAIMTNQELNPEEGN